MYVKKNLMLWAAVFALVMPLLFVGTASAKYMDDGSVPDGSGGWKTPNDGICVVGLHADGTMDIADGITNKRDCIYLQAGTMNGGTPFDLTGMTTSAACATADAAGNDGAKHQWATSFCTVSLAGLDRTQKMCEGKGGTWVTSGKCVAYNWLYRGQDATGTPLAFGTEGTTAAQNAGFCYTQIRTGVTATTSCPSVTGATGSGTASSTAAFGYSFSSGRCLYDYGINGAIAKALTSAAGGITAAGTNVDLSAYTTYGDCLAAGAAWANWIPKGGSGTDPIGGTATIATFDLTAQAVNADEGCLHCHSSVDQANGPAERWKDTYLKTGHKNMLRKVVAGSKWAGPDGNLYTVDTGGRAFDWNAATPTIGGNALYYVFGDWMAAEPESVGPVADVATYGCAACHTAGFKDNTNPGVQSIGTPSYTPGQPVAPYSCYVTAGHKWDLDGI